MYLIVWACSSNGRADCFVGSIPATSIIFMRYKILKYPTKFGLVCDNTKFALDDFRKGIKKDNKCFLFLSFSNKVEENLGSEYTCYPLTFTQAQKKSFSRHVSNKQNKLERRDRRRKKKGERMKESYAERRKYRPCDLGCGGEMSWCSCCEMYSNNCCVDWGTCQCS